VTELQFNCIIIRRRLKLAEACTNLKLQKVTGAIYVGNYLYCTPGRVESSMGDLLSFNLSRTRGQPVASLQVSVLADLNFANPGSSVSNNLGERVILKAGTGDSLATLPTLFTGYIVGVRKRPSLSDARKIILDITAEDEFAKIRYGGKFTRRVKLKDSAYAVITGGQRRQDGNMTLLKRVPAGKSGVSFISAESSGMENSPLIRTPDPQGKSPSGTTSSSSNAKDDGSESKSLVAEPKSVVASAGSQVSVTIRDQITGKPIDLSACQDMSSSGCLCHITPAPTLFSGESVSRTGLQAGVSAFPLMYEIKTDGTNTYFVFQVTGDLTSKATFVHPKTGVTCSVEFSVVPMHDHRDANRGGPAVGSFDSFIS